MHALRLEFFRVDKSLVSIVYSSTHGLFPFRCLALNNSGWRRVARIENYNAELKHGLCATTAYVARCYLPMAQTYMLLGKTGAFEVYHTMILSGLNLVMETTIVRQI